MTPRWWVLLSLALFLLAGCTHSTPTASGAAQTDRTPISSLPGTSEPVSTAENIDPVDKPAANAAASSPTPQLSGTPDLAELPRPQYVITATLDYAAHQLTAEETIHYVNRAPEALPELVLMIDPRNFPDVFRLKGLTWGNGQAVQDYALENAQLRIPLPEPLPPGGAIDLKLAYDLALPLPEPSPQVRPIPFGYTDKQTNLVDWYPFIPPYRSGEGWLAHQAGFFGEHLVYDKADFDIRLRLADRRDDLVIAASAPGVSENGWQHYLQEDARNFTWSVSPEYQVSTRQVGDTTVMAYTFPVHSAAGEAALNTTAAALAYYADRFGPYPHKTLSVVEADFLDGMEYDGLYFLSKGFYNLYQGTPGEYLNAIAAHETAHQWWYGRVGSDQAQEPWLDEAMSTFTELLYFEHYYPESVDWWWKYRVEYYDPRGPIDGSIYNPDGYRAYRDAVYLNGAKFLSELRLLIGDKAMFAFLKDYAGQMTDQIATGQDFFKILGEHTSADISVLTTKYFSNNPYDR